VQVTPSSKVVGDLAQFMVTNKLDAATVREKAESLSFPNSVVEFFQGAIGIPHGGFPEPLRTQIVRDLPTFKGRPGESLPPLDFDATMTKLKAKYDKVGPCTSQASHSTRRTLSSNTSHAALPFLPPLRPQEDDDPTPVTPFRTPLRKSRPTPIPNPSLFQVDETDLMSYVMYPKVFEQYKNDIEQFGDVSKLPTRAFIEPMNLGEEIEVELEKGKTLGIKLSAVGQVTRSFFCLLPHSLPLATPREVASAASPLTPHHPLLSPRQLNPKDATREVFFEFNGMPRSVFVADTTAKLSQVRSLPSYERALYPFPDTPLHRHPASSPVTQ
jgi:pyruvate carboxylase